MTLVLKTFHEIITKNVRKTYHSKPSKSISNTSFKPMFFQRYEKKNTKEEASEKENTKGSQNLGFGIPYEKKPLKGNQNLEKKNH